MGRATSENEIDADIDLDGGGSHSGAFLLGILLGAVVSAAAAVAISLTSPPPANLPLAGRVEIVGQPPAAEGEASAEASFDAAGKAAAEPNETSEPAIVAVVPQGSGALVAEPAEIPTPGSETPETNTPGTDSPRTATPEADTRETTAPDAARPDTMPSPDGQADISSGKDGLTGLAEAESAGVAPDPATAPAPADSSELAALPDTALQTAPGTPPGAAPGAAPDTAPDTGPDAPPAASAQPGPTGAALADNARPFDAPRQAPLLSVVLIGDGVADLSADRLALLTMPLTVAIPPGIPRAGELGSDARAAGHEVLADLSLRTGTGATETEATETGGAKRGAAEADSGDPALAPGSGAPRIASLDMAVGATASGGTADADLLAPVLAELGRRGFAWVDTGAAIGTPAERIAREIGMPYTQGNKSIGDDASPDQIYRAIDSAAHLARQWGTSVLFLDASEPALQALVRWGLEQRSDNAVWFAPISAVIERRGAL